MGVGEMRRFLPALSVLQGVWPRSAAILAPLCIGIVAGVLLAGCAPMNPAPPTAAAPAVQPAQVQVSPAAPQPTPVAPTTEPSPSPTLAPIPETARKTLRVFGAGSLIQPFTELEKAFEARHPEVDVQSEFHGSIQVMRHVSELHEKIDVSATADYALIPMLLYAVKDPETGKPYADWYLRFATNRLSLAYTPQSKYAKEITPENWYEIVSSPDVRVGLADPRFDAAGYRALMALRLAEYKYGKPGLLNNFIAGRFTFPITVFAEDDYTEITVPEVLEPVAGSGLIVRGASIMLIALLESGDLDYAFEYESVIRQHNLQWVPLPDEVNLGFEGQNENYQRVEVAMDFHRFASVKPVFRGEQIGYGVTIPSSAPQPELAAEYLAFLLGPEGRQIMDANYHPLFDPVICDQAANIPETLRGFCAPPASP